MIDIHTFNKSLKASWIKEYLDPTNNGRWKFFFDVNLKLYGEKFIFSCNLHKDDIPLLKIRNPFVCEVMSIWAELHFSDAVAISIANVGDQIIWLNSLVRIYNQPVFRKHWMDHGVCKISHLLDEGGNLLGYDAMKSNFQELNWLEYCGIASAVKSLINNVQNEPTYEVVSTEGTSITELTSKSKVNNFIYKSLLRKRISTPIRSQEKWLSDLQVENASDIDWKDAYTIAFHCTASTKLRTFHYKFLHRRITTNDFLKKINLKQSDKCSFCQREIETISHLFLRCSATIAFWNDVKQFLIQKGLKSTALTDLHLTGSPL